MAVVRFPRARVNLGLPLLPPLNSAKSKPSWQRILKRSPGTPMSLPLLWTAVQGWIESLILEQPLVASYVVEGLVRLHEVLTQQPAPSADTGRAALPRLADKLQRIALDAPDKITELEVWADAILVGLGPPSHPTED